MFKLFLVQFLISLGIRNLMKPINLLIYKVKNSYPHLILIIGHINIMGVTFSKIHKFLY